MDNLVLIAGNWIIIALFVISLLLIIRGWFYKKYLRIFYGLPFGAFLFWIAVIVVSVIMWRESIVVPLEEVQAWLPGSSFITQFVYWLYSTHIISILLFGGFIILMWKKFDALTPAVFTGWLALGLIEISFIPQHFIMIQDFVGLAWYGPFICLILPFVLDRKKFQYNKRGLIFIAGAIILQYLIILLFPWSMTSYDPATQAFGINYNLFPEPPWISWFFMELNHVIKLLFLFAFSYWELK